MESQPQFSSAAELVLMARSNLSIPPVIFFFFTVGYSRKCVTLNKLGNTKCRVTNSKLYIVTASLQRLERYKRLCQDLHTWITAA